MSTIFVNRRDELRLLEALFKARLGGAGYAVSLCGTGRVGKSRLVDEFLKGKIGFRPDYGLVASGGGLLPRDILEPHGSEGERKILGHLGAE